MLDKEKLLNNLWKTTEIPFISFLWRLLYFVCYQASRAYFLAFSGAKHVYVKGSYVSGTYAPLISDIDFVLIYSDDGKLTKRRADLWKRICPIVKDADCFSEESFYLRRRFGSLKYANLENWRKLDSRFVRPASRSHFPVKDSFDIAQEIYFFWEWVHFNLNQGPNSYRLQCVNKALQKASQIVGAQFKSVTNAFEALEVLEGIVVQAQEKSQASKRFSSLVSFEQSEILSRDWYKSKFNVCPSSPTFLKNKINMSENSFKFFYCLGILDSSVLLEEIIPKEDKRLAAALSIEYFLNIEEGKFNQTHRSSTENIEIAKELALLDETDSRKELSRFQHLYRIGELKKGVTYWFNTKFSAKLEGKVFARMENCRSDDVVFSDRRLRDDQRSVNINFFSYDDFQNATLSLTSTFSSFSSFEMDEFLKSEMSSEKESEPLWVAEEKKDMVSGEKFNLTADGEFKNCWHKAVFHMKGLDSEYRVEAFYPDGEVLSSPRIQFDPNDYLTIYFRPGQALKKVTFKVTANNAPAYAEVVCFSVERP